MKLRMVGLGSNLVLFQIYEPDVKAWRQYSLECASFLRFMWEHFPEIRVNGAFIDAMNGCKRFMSSASVCEWLYSYKGNDVYVFDNERPKHSYHMKSARGVYNIRPVTNQYERVYGAWAIKATGTTFPRFTNTPFKTFAYLYTAVKRFGRPV